MEKHILIIDDEASIRDTLAGVLEDEGLIAVTAASAEEGLALLAERKIDLALLDIWLGDGMDGLTALDEIRARWPLPVIMISGHGTIETAVQATRKGAFDFIEKPLSYDKLILSITNGLRFSQLEQENRLLRETAPPPVELAGTSEAIARVREEIARVAPTNSWVLILGEHGTGKELVARNIHRLSQTSHLPLVDVNCAAIPDDLIESELFGHEKGSFTGAVSSRQGRFDQADGGILFLDEIGDMSLKAQAKILRVLQEQKFERVGGAKTIKVSVRILAATNKNLEEEIEGGRFRADLLHRLSVVPIRVPPLRERRQDIAALVISLSASLFRRGVKAPTFSDDALRLMAEHDWPGNVRELRNFIERMAIMCPVGLVDAAEARRFLGPAAARPLGETASELELYALGYKEAKTVFERQYLRRKLTEHDGNITSVAKVIGLDRSHLSKKLKELGLSGQDEGGEE
ncbi:MAG: sigma-54 dependent transcriptional regulator [Desulfobulbaceae bacterium]|jgi:two-component system nitrogen regulation response regulator NtrX|nr:sigma-54 dependent transcriptional regulator [Desulfobulbaceae bacterium]